MHDYLDSLAGTDGFGVAVEQFRSRFERELTSIQGAGPGSDRGQAVLGAAVRLVEALVGGIQRDLNTDRSQLLGELAVTKARVEVLERQLDDTLRLLLDAQRHRKPGLIRGGLLALGGFLAGIGSGFTQGVGGAMYADAFDGAAAPAAVQLSIECLALDQALDESGVYVLAGSGASGTAPAQDQPASGEREPEDDVTDADPWLSIPAQLEDEYVVWREAGFTPQQALDWHDFGFSSHEALRWLAYNFEPTEARAWIDRSLQSDARESIEPSEAHEYEGYDFSPDGAMQWRDHGFDAEDAAEWEAYGFEPSDANDWRSEGLDAETADEWRETGRRPDDARLPLDGTDDGSARGTRAIGTQ